MDFDHIYAWEAKRIDPVSVMREIPARIKGKYHWFNIPADPEEGSGDNPFTILLSETEPEDFVLLKIDIDNSTVEERFVQQLLSRPDILSRVDEMFWEHHVRFKPMTMWWGDQLAHTMQYSIELFHQLRSAGIRVHSWV